MKSFLKRAVARVAAAPSDPGFRVLLYHAVDEMDAADHLALRVPPSALGAQMRFLRAAGYRVVPLSGILGGLADGTGPRVAITFDDGYRSQLRAAAVLDEFGFPATFFVVVDFLEGRKATAYYSDAWEHMGWDELMGLAASGFDVGAHSLTHRYLTRCGPAELEREVSGAKACLEDRLVRVIPSFSYPHGAYNERVRSAVQAAGFRLACTSVYGGNRAPWPRFELRRIEISGTDGLADFQRKLQGKYDWLGPWQRWRGRHA